MPKFSRFEQDRKFALAAKLNPDVTGRESGDDSLAEKNTHTKPSE